MNILSNGCTPYTLLYDDNFKLIKTIQALTPLESVFMNEKFICLFSSHKSHAWCTIFEHELNELESSGQQLNAEKPFYMEKSILTWKD